MWSHRLPWIKGGQEVRKAHYGSVARQDIGFKEGTGGGPVFGFGLAAPHTGDAIPGRAIASALSKTLSTDLSP